MQAEILQDKFGQPEPLLEPNAGRQSRSLSLSLARPCRCFTIGSQIRGPKLKMSRSGTVRKCMGELLTLYRAVPERMRLKHAVIPKNCE